MPWQERSPMDERVQFITDYQRQLFTMTTLCERYGVSRKTGYKLVARYDARASRDWTSDRRDRTIARRPPSRASSTPSWPCARIPDLGREKTRRRAAGTPPDLDVARHQYGE